LGREEEKVAGEGREESRREERIECRRNILFRRLWLRRHWEDSLTVLSRMVEVPEVQLRK
jgi:hypothetical protein